MWHKFWKQYLYKIPDITMKQIITLCLISIVMMNFSQCGSAKKLQEEASLKIGDVYYKNWISGVKGGGAGFNLYIPIISNPKNIKLDSAFFKGKQVKLTKKDTFFIGRFKSKINRKPDIIMSNDPYAEYGNKVPEITQKTPFELNDDECIVSYEEAEKTIYIKIGNILKKESETYQ